MASANEFGPDAGPLVVDVRPDASPQPWTPLFWHSCSFGPDVFSEVMLNLIRNPNINSSWLFRADIVHDEQGDWHLSSPPRIAHGDPPGGIPTFDGFACKRYLVRTLVPRNSQRDDPLDQTCLLYESGQDSGDGRKRTLVVYIPHVSSEDAVPFYHPKAQGIAFLHDWRETAAPQSSVSISYLFFPGPPRSPKSTRTALHLISAVQKHGAGRISGYVKRVQHDVLVPQAPLQDRYAVLKQRYARPLLESWAESTDPVKHVFEDLAIAAFLMELWAGMYADVPFPGFVDIGCGNGLLVHILAREGYRGWGFDARARKSWASYDSNSPDTADTSDSSVPAQGALRQLVLVPAALRQLSPSAPTAQDDEQTGIHGGVFPAGTFIISNHADELTPWTPILAAASQCPFIMIPCCSHDLSGAKFRAPPPRDKTKSASAYSSLVSWVAVLAHDCGWEVETEMLRIPSTRNTALVGRRRTTPDGLDAAAQAEIIRKYGGADGYLENALKLAGAAPRGH